MNTPTDPAGYIRLYTNDDSGKQCQALFDAIVLAAADYQFTMAEELRNADTKTAVYQWMDETPVESLVIELKQALSRIGYEIRPKNA